MEDREAITFIIYFGVFIILFFVLAIVLVVVVYQRKRILKENEYELSKKKNELRLFKSIIDTQEAEREKIATNIHDEIGPLIFALKLHLSQHESLLNQGLLTKDDLINERKYVDSIMENIRRASKDLSPKSLLRLGLVSAIKSFLNDLSGIDLNIDEQIDEQIEVKDELAINVYRVVLELVNNLMKHGKPSQLDVEVSLCSSEIKIVLKHNGIGFSNDDFIQASENSDGIGLKSLKSRITMLHASLDYQITQESKVIFKTPLNDESKN